MLEAGFDATALAEEEPKPIVKVFPVGKTKTNCIIVGCEKSRECVVIDPGADADRIVHEIVQSSLLLKRILVTHAHFDAVLALDDLRKHLRLRTQFVADLRGRAKVHRGRIEVAMHPSDADLLLRVGEQCNDLGVPELAPEKPLTPASEALQDGKEISIGEIKCVCLHTPGITPGACSFYFPDLATVVTGKTLIRGAVGRTSWDGVPALKGSASALDNLDSIHDKLFCLPSDTAVIPGKGPCSFIRVERNQNPYARQIRRRYVSYDRYLEERDMLGAEAERKDKERRAMRRRKVFGDNGAQGKAAGAGAAASTEASLGYSDGRKFP